ncbi:hypothetical protein R6Q59_029107 [Mikania micrantha]
MQNGKGKEIEVQEETQEIDNIEDMIVFLDLLKVINMNLLNEESIRRKFNKMVHWFVKYVIKQRITRPPKIKEQIKGNQGRILALHINRFRPKIRTTDKTMMLYKEYQDTLDWYYNNIKKRKEETGTVIFEGGSSSMQKDIPKSKKEQENSYKKYEASMPKVDETNLPYKKRKISAKRDWPPGCGPNR